MTVVLDASVILAILRGESVPASTRDRALSPDAVISAVNFAEVVTKIAERGGTDDQIAGLRAQFAAQVRPHDVDQAVETGRLRRSTRHKGLSLGDRACLALARALGAPVLTADRAWAGLDVGLEIEVIR